MPSAPGESLPPPLKSTRGTASENRHDIVTRTIVSEFERNVTRANVMVSDIRRTIVQGQGGTGGGHPLVSEGYAPATAK